MLSPPTALDLSICIVNWNVCELLRACLASLPAACAGLMWQAIVVDNASTDDSVAMLKAEFPDTVLIANSQNAGFTRGNNQATAQASGCFICFLNPDTTPAPGALTTLVRYLQAHAEVGVAGPQLRYGDGSLQSSRRRFPTLGMALVDSTPIGWRWPNHPALRRYRMAERNNDETQPVDWVTGACFVVRREMLEQVGGLDENFFMYSEELDWCYRAQACGWSVHYVPAARVTHYEAKSSDQAGAARHIRFNTSKVHYFRKHQGWVAAEFLRFALLAMFAAEIGVEGSKWLLGHKRRLRAERVQAYLQVLRSGLQTDSHVTKHGF